MQQALPAHEKTERGETHSRHVKALVHAISLRSQKLQKPSPPLVTMCLSECTQHSRE